MSTKNLSRVPCKAEKKVPFLPLLGVKLPERKGGEKREGVEKKRSLIKFCWVLL